MERSRRTSKETEVRVPSSMGSTGRNSGLSGSVETTSFAPLCCSQLPWRPNRHPSPGFQVWKALAPEAKK